MRRSVLVSAMVLLGACNSSPDVADDADPDSTEASESDTDDTGDKLDQSQAADLGEDVHVVQIDMQGFGVCGVLSDGGLKCWGDNVDGILGLGHEEAIGDDEYPVVAAPVDVGGPVSRVVLDQGIRACAILEDGGLRCWGVNERGELGYGHTDWIGDDESPATQGDVPVGGAVIDVCLPAGYSCAVLEGGDVRCWGPNQAYAVDPLGLPDLTIGDDEPASDAPLVPLSGPATQLACGDGPCALLESGEVECWGAGFHSTNQEGEQVLDVQTLPIEDVIDIAARHDAFCAVSALGDVRCWGEWGGYPGMTYANGWEAPPPIELGGDAVEVDVGNTIRCALMEDGTVRCWGLGGCGLGLGQCPSDGDGTWCSVGIDEHPAAAPPVDLGAPALSVANGYVGSCALLESGEVTCWGSGPERLGYCPLCDDTPQACADGLGQCCVGDDETPASVGPVRVF